MNLKQRDRKFLARERDESEDIQVARSKGSLLFDGRGETYIDFLAGWCVGNLGWGNDVVRNAIRRSKSPDYIYPYYLYEPWVDLAELLAKITPGKLQKSFRATGGTEAVDLGLQIAMAYTDRKKFICIKGAYHGNSVATTRLTESGQRVAPPLNDRAAGTVERMLKKRDVAALIMEPISCNLGVLIPDDEFMTRVAKACKRYGTLLIMDEVASGFGRTGRMFATSWFDIQPDILCMGKAITAGCAPMGATITTAEVANAVESDVSFNSTYGWHPLSVDAALANLRWMVRNETKLMKQVTAMSEFFRLRLSAMGFSTRIMGLAIGVETGDKDYAEKVAKRCRRKGLLLTTADDIITMYPALNIDRSVAAEGLDILERCSS